jgi:hypothetical protein
MAERVISGLKATAGCALMLFALSGGLACNFVGSPTPITRPTDIPTGTIPNPTVIIYPTSTPEPTPSVTPKPTEAIPTPTVVAHVPPAKGGPIMEATPTPDIRREALTEMARQYYEKNPLMVSGKQLNSIVVSERTQEGKVLISVRTFAGDTNTLILAGNWGYFSFNDKLDITGIVWAKVDTYKDSQGRTGYLGDSEIATAGAGFFGAEKVGYYTKDGKMIASLNPATGEPVLIIPPTPIPTATQESTPTTKPTLTPKPTSTPTHEVVSDNTICAIKEMAGNCYPRTSSRTGTMPDGHVLPDGVLYIHQMNPDARVQMQWILPGRIVNINYGANTLYIKGLGNDIFSIELVVNNPKYYSRMLRVPMPFGVEFRQVYPEISPRLGTDIVVGDYVSVIPNPTVAKYWPPNNISPTQAYQMLVEAQKQGVRVVSGFVEIIQ